MQILITRHGKSKHNLGSEQEHTFAGNEIDNELAKEGIENARLLANKIKNLENVNLIICSPLLRSKQTAEIIASSLNIPVVELSELVEINVGDFKGQTEEGVRRNFPQAAECFYSGQVEKWAFPNGESFMEVSKRVDNLIEKIKILPVNKIVLAGHGMINRIIFYKLLPARSDLWKERNYPHDRIVEINI